MKYPKKIPHWLADKEVFSFGGGAILKYDPASGGKIAVVSSGTKKEVDRAVCLAEKSFEGWSRLPVASRAKILKKTATLLLAKQEEIAEIVAFESGKPKKHALGEVKAAVQCGLFISANYDKFQQAENLISSIPGRLVKMIRQSIGPGALIVPFNNPMASIAWKTFPALLCGNAVVLKSHEDTPYTAIWFAKVLKEAGLPAGVFSVIQGAGKKAGVPLVENSAIKFISFTGSVAAAVSIIKASANRLAKVAVEAGGKNPLVVCADADIDKAVAAAVSGAFVDAGQRCAAASRLIIFDAVYEEFKKRFLKKVQALKVGVGESDDFGAIISEKRLGQILKAVSHALARGGTLLAGGQRLRGLVYKSGYFMAPTVLENISPDDEISQTELFAPVVILYRVKNLKEALALANNSRFKLSGAIHTKSRRQAEEFIAGYRVGVVRVNGPTHGSEPHMPFGGLGLSGNGWREPGLLSFDFYSERKQISSDGQPNLK
jgi:aldehyde dehydrogenase (NAD+)